MFSKLMNLLRPPSEDPSGEQHACLLVLEVEGRCVDHKGVVSNEKSSRYKLILTKVRDAIWSDVLEEVCDYDSGRISTVDVGSGTYWSSAVLAKLSFRQFEFENRMALLGMLEAGGGAASGSGVSVVLSRHSMSVGGDETNEELQWDGQRASGDGLVLFERSDAVWRVPSWAAHRFTRYVRRRFGSHPGILRRLQGANFIPQGLHLSFPGPGWTDISDIRVLSCEIIDSPRDLLAGLRRTFDGRGGEIWQGMLDASVDGPAGELDFARSRAQANVFMDDERWFETLLSVLASTWRHTDVPQKMKDTMPVLGEMDPNAGRLMALFKVLQAPDTDLAANLAELDELRLSAGDMAYAIDVIRGTVLVQMKESERALEAYRSALRGDPRLAGVYHDIGLIFSRQYNFDDAYRCWDFARWLAPGHSIMSDIDDQEQRLLECEAKVTSGRLL